VLKSLIQLEEARANLTGDVGPGELANDLTTEKVLQSHLNKLMNKANVLEWRALPRRLRFMHVDPVVEEKFLDIQRDTATSVGALAVAGATISITVMYSASRGNLWYLLNSSWLFMMSIATTSALSLTISGSGPSIFNDSELDEYSSLLDTYFDLRDTYSERLQGNGLPNAPRRKWVFLQYLGIFAVSYSLTGVAFGWNSLAAGLLEVNLHSELKGKGPGVSGGPDYGEQGMGPAARLAYCLVIAIFIVPLLGSHLFRVWFTAGKSPVVRG